MGTQASQLSNPFSTGGGGANFENNVQASFVLLMLADGFVPCLPLTSINRIKLQGKYAGFQTDDLVVFSSDIRSGKEFKLLAQIKHSMTISDASTVFRDVIKAAWDDYCDPHVFTKGVDCLALITGPLSCGDISSTRTLLEWARASQDSADFFNKVNLENFSSQEKRLKLKAFQVQLTSANNDVQLTDSEVFEFLRHFHLLGYDLDIRAGVELSLLHSIIGQYQASEVGSVWLQIVDEVRIADQNAGTISKSSVNCTLQSVFSQRKVESIPTSLSLQTEPPAFQKWSLHPDASSLVIACLLGSWNEKNANDRVAYETLSRSDFRKWLLIIQNLVTDKDSPLILSDGRWRIKDRLGFWNELSTRIFDSHLDDFKAIAITVLGEIDPKFELPKENRFAASIYGKNLKYSLELRKGISESLALLGSGTGNVDHVSQQKSEITVAAVIQEILSPDDWRRWGSLDQLLPQIAEAAPSVFLDAVETALASNPCPFVNLFLEEGNGISGGNYMTGLLWALEALAWSEERLSRVTLILGELATLDPGGNWGNRPINSLATIFLPWMPQTLARVPKLKIAVQALSDEFPAIASKMFINMLPNQHQSSSGSYKPKYRGPLAPDFKVSVTNREYWDRVEIFAEQLITMAKADMKLLCQLVKHLDSLPRASFEKLIAFLKSADLISVGENEKAEIWESLVSFISRHRKFPNAKWVLDKAVLDQLDILAIGLAPEDPRYLYRRLFSGNDFDLYEDTGDWQLQQQKLEETRQAAVRILAAQHGVQGLIEYSLSIDNGYRLGWSWGQIEELPTDPILPIRCIDRLETSQLAFMNGYVASKYERLNFTWLRSLALESWENEQVVDLLCRLPFTQQIWEMLPGLLHTNEQLYWKRVCPNPFSMRGNINYVVEKLLEAGRPRLALECLFTDNFMNKVFKTDLVVKSFLASLFSLESISSSDPYHITELIKELQDRLPVDSEDLFQIEWAYLPYLDRMNGAEPKTLERKLSRDPNFFCEMIRYLYRSEKVDPEADPEPDPDCRRQAIAYNSWKLLNDWSRIPALLDNGQISDELFLNWLETTKLITTESGHFSIAMQQVGKVLFYSPSDSSGLWINKTVAKILNARDGTELRTGYCIQVANSRGAHTIDPSGADERALAANWREKAVAIEDAGFPRFAVSLRELATDYDREAERVIMQFGENLP